MFKLEWFEEKRFTCFSDHDFHDYYWNMFLCMEIKTLFEISLNFISPSFWISKKFNSIKMSINLGKIIIVMINSIKFWITHVYKTILASLTSIVNHGLELKISHCEDLIISFACIGDEISKTNPLFGKIPKTVVMHSAFGSYFTRIFFRPK